MPVYKVKDYKIINGIKIKKTKDEFNKETCNGTKLYFFKCQYEDSWGNKKQKRSKQYSTSKEADIAEAKFKLKHGNDAPINTKTETIYDLYQKYFFLDVYNNKDSSLYTKESRIRTHILPFFLDNKTGKYATINSITPDKINGWKNWLESTKFDSNKKDKQGKNIKIYLSIASKQANYSAFSSLMTYAVEKYNLTFNPMKLTENFKNISDKVIEDEPIRFITKEEYNTFISFVDDNFKTDFHFLYEVGCRKGEYQAITWEDIFFSKQQIRINKTLSTRNINGGVKITNTKNKKVRYIDISEKLMNELKKLYDEMSKLDGFTDKWFVFGGINYIPSSTLTRVKDKAFDLLKQNGHSIQRITIHEFRHSSASYMISNGIPVEIIAYRLGDTVETIRKVYAHLFPDTQKDAKILFNNL